MKSKAPRLWAGLTQGATVMVDTAPFIYVLESHPQWADQFVGLFEAAAKGDLTIALSTITLAEVLTGPFKAGQTARPINPPNLPMKVWAISRSSPNVSKNMANHLSKMCFVRATAASQPIGADRS